MNTDDELMVFAAVNTGEFAWLLVSRNSCWIVKSSNCWSTAANTCCRPVGWTTRKIVRIKTEAGMTLWAEYSLNPVELQLQWAVQYDKEGFVGKDAPKSCLTAKAHAR